MNRRKFLKMLGMLPAVVVAPKIAWAEKNPYGGSLDYAEEFRTFPGSRHDDIPYYNQIAVHGRTYAEHKAHREKVLAHKRDLEHALLFGGK